MLPGRVGAEVVRQAVKDAAVEENNSVGEAENGALIRNQEDIALIEYIC